MKVGARMNTNKQIKNIVKNSKTTQSFISELMNHSKSKNSNQVDENDIFYKYQGMRYETILKAIIYLLIQKGIITEDDFYGMMDAILIANKLSEE